MTRCMRFAIYRIKSHEKEKNFLLSRLELLERVLFRLGTADSDEQLESAVNKFLTPVLLKITSTNESVRCKV